MSTSATFIAIYRGATIGEAHLLAVSADPALVQQVIRSLLRQRPVEAVDPAVRALERGRKEALRSALPPLPAREPDRVRSTSVEPGDDLPGGRR